MSAFLTFILLSSGGLVHANGVGGPQLTWRVVPSEAGAPTRVLALDEATGQLALGSARGSRILGPSGETLANVRREAVRGLAFSGGGLLVGSARGLYEVGPDGKVFDLPLGAGAGVALGEVQDLDARGDSAAVATHGELHVRWGPFDWARVSLPPGVAERVVFADWDGTPALVVWGRGELWSIARGASHRAVRHSAPRLAASAVPPSLARMPTGELLVVYPDALALRLDAGRWKVHRPSLPPGATLRRYAHALGHHWLASDAGLLVAEEVAGPWRRASGPLGSRGALALVGRGSVLYVATEREVYRAEAFAAAPTPALIVAVPGVAALHRAVLSHQSLEVGDVSELRHGLARRGWLPEVSLLGGYERSRSRGGDYDESVVSGMTRELHDRDYDRDRDLQVGVTLRWDLGDLAYHPESIDVSREARALVALRDDVLDEVDQLYFERLRALGKLSLLEPGAPESHALETRVAELTAGLDAWTGGWFSRAALASTSGPVTPGPHTPGRKTK